MDQTDDNTRLDLINLIAQNKGDYAYKHLREQYYNVLLKFAIAYLKSNELAEEVVGDVLFQVWSSQHKLENINNLRVYIFTAVRNRCFTQLARLKREQDLFLNTPDYKENLYFNHNINPENMMVTSELSKFIREIVDDLPPRCRQIYKMIREDGLRNKDVAAQLNISVNTIDVQLAIALKKLSKAIQLYYNR
jgi:RNA polymerase sigma-70 factor (family 1)